MAIRILRYAALRSIWVLCDASGVAALPGRFLPMNCGAFWRRFFLFNRRPTSNSDAGCAAAGILVLWPPSPRLGALSNRETAMFAALPLLGLPVLFYAIFVLVSVGPPPDLAEAHVSQILFSIGMSSHVRWVVRVTDLFVFTSVVVLFIELLRATQSGRIAIINHSLSMLLFIICLVLFLLHPGFATSTFFLILSMVLLDVLAGFVVSIVSARRDIDVVR